MAKPSERDTRGGYLLFAVVHRSSFGEENRETTPPARAQQWAAAVVN